MNTHNQETHRPADVLFENLTKIIEDGKKKIIESLIGHIFEYIKETSILGRTEGSIALKNYDYEVYRDRDFDVIIKGVQDKLIKYNIKVEGGWSDSLKGLYIDIYWNKKWKSYWFFGKRYYYG